MSKNSCHFHLTIFFEKCQNFVYDLSFENPDSWSHSVTWSFKRIWNTNPLQLCEKIVNSYPEFFQLFVVRVLKGAENEETRTICTGNRCLSLNFSLSWFWIWRRKRKFDFAALFTIVQLQLSFRPPLSWANTRARHTRALRPHLKRSVRPLCAKPRSARHFQQQNNGFQWPLNGSYFCWLM